ncbi:MAG: T9SS type A sorting domain-containing protein [Lentimicrobiaceae bacterium]|nr:T9SS type A sorting domain-containing protein [Lentimicrobiaceae bacterium]
MKRILTFKGLILGVCLWAYGVSGVSQDTITFEWAAVDYKSFEIQAANGESFTVHWGDGNSDPYTGAGSSNITPNHLYATAGDYTVVVIGDVSCRFIYLNCINASLISLDVSENAALERLYCYYNSISSLDVSNCTALTYLDCTGNALSSLDVSDNTALEELHCSGNSINSLDVSNHTALVYLHCYNNSIISLKVNNNAVLNGLVCFNNHLPLSDLYAASLIAYGKELGQQTLLPQTVAIGKVVDFSTQAKFGTPDTATVFVVTQNGLPASASDYTEANGVFTFHTIGNYTITMTNDAIISVPAPAEVSVDITVREANTDASLSDLTVSGADLNPAFSSTHYEYAVCLETAVRSIALTATPNDPNATVIGDGQQQLNTDTNVIIITVTAEDGITTQDYIVTIINGCNTGIVETQHATSLRIYPNPTSGKFSVVSYQLSEMGGEIEVFDVVGRKLLSHTPLTSHSSPLIEIDISHLANGLYFLKIDGKTVKVVKE